MGDQIPPGTFFFPRTGCRHLLGPMDEEMHLAGGDVATPLPKLPCHHLLEQILRGRRGSQRHRYGELLLGGGAWPLCIQR